MKHRYNIPAITLHWVMAVLILSLIIMGLLMTSDLLEKFLQFQMYQWHKAVGVIVLTLLFVRFIVRLVSQKPQDIEGLTPLENKASLLGHWALYSMMFIMPISGWVMVSASPFGFPTIVFDLFEWPHLPFVEANENVEAIAKLVHELSAYALMALVAGHVMMVVKHWLIDGQNLLPRMGIGRPKGEN